MNWNSVSVVGDLQPAQEAPTSACHLSLGTERVRSSIGRVFPWPASTHGRVLFTSVRTNLAGGGFSPGAARCSRGACCVQLWPAWGWTGRLKNATGIFLSHSLVASQALIIKGCRVVASSRPPAGGRAPASVACVVCGGVWLRSPSCANGGRNGLKLGELEA